MAKARRSGEGKQAKNAKKRVVSFHIPEHLLREIDELVENSIFQNRSEFIRTAIFMLLKDIKQGENKRPALLLGYR